MTLLVVLVLNEEEKLPGTRAAVHEAIKRFHESGCLMRRFGSERPSKIAVEIKQVVEAQIRIDDETSALQLH